MYFILFFILIISLSLILFLKHPQFGKMPSGNRLDEIKKAKNYSNGSFQNLNHTPPLAEGANMFSILKDFLFKKSNTKPLKKIPSLKTDLLNLAIEKDVLVWFGHSSYYIQIDKKRILVDPVFSGSASPLPFGVKSFNGSDIYTTDDIPEIDYLFITHDHWDHLDYKTIKKLTPKIKKVICALGVGEHLEHWGYHKNLIIEKNWNEEIKLEDGFIAHTVPSRHFSGRGIKRNASLWTSYVLITPTMKIFIGGDSGYDTHFAEIGNTFGSFDLAIIENGQYNKNWRYIHLLPDEILKVAKELNTKRLFPVHNSKFNLSLHSWDEPMSLIIENNKTENISLITPQIGEQVNLKDTTQKFTEWWKEIS